MITTVRSFLIGLSVSVVVLASFVAGALADRLFVLKPVDYFVGEFNSRSEAQNSPDKRVALDSLFTEENRDTVADIAESASPSVVTISAKQTERVVDPLGRRSFFGMPLQFREEEVQRDIGTGFVVNDQGFVVTNKHVVSQLNTQYTIIDATNTEYEVERIYRDPVNDLAILQVNGLDVSSLPLGDSDTLRVGEPAIAIGTALGEFRHTVTTGVISGLGRGITAGDGFSGQYESLEGVIQTDTAINPGNSGGPLLNSSGEVIGVNVAVTAGAENIGFALPINMVKASLDNFNQTGQFERPFLGIQYQVITEEAATANDVPRGAVIMEVVEGSSAQDAGLTQGDILLSIDGESITEESSILSIINKKRVGDTVSLEIWREGERSSLTATLKLLEE
ncbi:MAG: trypsin-like peptidase domain-containing protein [Microgenomates group bacterium]